MAFEAISGRRGGGSMVGRMAVVALGLLVVGCTGNVVVLSGPDETPIPANPEPPPEPFPEPLPEPLPPEPQPTPLGFCLGDAVSTGTIEATAAEGGPVGELVPGNWYAIETSGGPWFAHGGGSGPAYYGAWVSDDGGVTWFRLNDSADDGKDFTVAWGAAAEPVGASYQRGYWQATGTSIRIQVADQVFEDNSGSLSWTLFDAYPCD
ncbi:Hypothetical protein CAP_6247 [Chondromyces apiculatus DSM 436]|uniref:Uncharacterized protein n=2 Tax=Chondromyces apiculatus TaxID=51 RepID=A0A017T2C0_9BACT|nr:Hypothetical protein CAP_6247 [Chondromyces apiculatus DSM 436]